MAKTDVEMKKQQDSIRLQFIRKVKKEIEISLDPMSDPQKVPGIVFEKGFRKYEFSELNKLLIEEELITALILHGSRHVVVDYQSKPHLCSWSHKPVIEKQELQMLCDTLASNSTLKYLHFNVSSYSSTQLIEGEHPPLVGIGDEGAEMLAKALSVNCGLRYLKVTENELGILGITALAKALSVNKSICSLTLREQKMDDDCTDVLAEALYSNHSITHLDLQSCNISSYAAKTLARALLKNDTLLCLDLRQNPIDDKALKAFAEILLFNNTLQKLIVGSVSSSRKAFTQTCIEYFAKSLESSSHSFLELILMNDLRELEIPKEIERTLKQKRELFQNEILPFFETHEEKVFETYN